MTDVIAADASAQSFATIPQVFARSVATYGDEPALSRKVDGEFAAISFRELDRRAGALALALIRLLGVQKGELVALVSNNRPEWMICSLAIHFAGAADVPRASDTPSEILAAILGHAEPVVVILENERQLEQVREALPALRAAVLIDARPSAPGDAMVVQGGDDGGAGGCALYTLDELVDAGAGLMAKHATDVERRRADVDADDLATVIYTSGTTGTPKGVALTHGNYMLNIKTIPKLLGVERERILSILQPWHAYERQVQMMGLSVGCCIYYSSVLALRGDLKTVRPTVMATVPELWVTLYKGVFKKIDAEKPAKRRLARWLVRRSLASAGARRVLDGREPLLDGQADRFHRAKARAQAIANAPFHALADRLVFKEIRANLGACLRLPIVGGGPLPDAIDEFFDAAGLPLLEGYGMTEAMVVMAIRDEQHRVLKSAGRVLDGMEHRIVDERGRPCAAGAAGRLHVRGPNIMRGYHKDAERTREVLTTDGWLDTGDLARNHLDGTIRVLSRLDDTLVLTSGKNVNAVYLENELRASVWTERAVVVGAGKPFVGAFLAPSHGHLEALARKLALPFTELREVAEHPRIVEHYRELATRMTSDPRKFAPHERVQLVRLWMEDFEIGREISQTLKLRRQAFYRLYAAEIEALYADRGASAGER